MASGPYRKLFFLLLGVSYASSYSIPSDDNDLNAEVQIDDLINPTYFTYKVHIVLGNSVEFDVVGSTADGNKQITVEPPVGGPRTKFVRQEVTKTVEGGKPVIQLVIKSTVWNVPKKIKYNGTTTITYKAHQDVQWFTEHRADAILNYKGEGCDPDDIECNVKIPPKKDPCVRVVTGDIARVPAIARPKYNSNYGQTSTSSGGKVSVVCQSEEVSSGSYRYTCSGVDPALITIRTEHILWLNGPAGCEEQVDIVIPNYRFEELIRGALKASSTGSTNINVLLRKPETIHDVQVQDGHSGTPSPPVVNVLYEQVQNPVSLHYPTDRKYNPLSGPIREPGQTGSN